MRLQAWLDLLQSQLRYCFTREEALEALDLGDAALTLALNRQKHKGRLISPRRGFYVLVPLEFKQAGSPPANNFIEDLMRYMGQFYYLGLLSASAEYETHHPSGVSSVSATEIVYVITDRACRSARFGSTELRFVQKASVSEAPVQRRTSVLGSSYLVSSPEATALDLLQFADRCGGETAVLPVIQALAPQLDRERLRLTAAACSPATVYERLLRLLGA